MKQLSKREKVITGIVAVVLVGFLVNHFVLEPQTKKMSQLRKELDSLNEQAASIGPKLVEFNQLNSNLVVKKQQLAEMEEVLPSKAELAEIINAVSAEARAQGLQLQQLRPQRSTAMRTRAGRSAQYRQLNVNIGMRGRYEELGDFLAALEQLPFYIRVAELQVQRGRAQPPRVDIQLKLAIVMRS